MRLLARLTVYCLFSPLAVMAGDVEFPRVDPSTSKIVRSGDKLIVNYLDEITKEAKEKIIELEKISKGKLFFHWTLEQTPPRWMKQGGKILPDELRWLSSSGTGVQAGGPGWYVSSNPFDSQAFGVRAVVEEIPEENLWVLKNTKFRPSYENTLAIEEMLKKENVIGTKMVDRETWYTIFDTRATSNLRPLDSNTAINTLLKLKEDPSKRLEQIFARMDVSPNPYFEKYYPEINHTLQGKILSEQELAKLAKTHFPPYGQDSAIQKKLFDAIKPEQKLDLIRNIVPTNDPQALMKLLNIDQKLGTLPNDIGKVHPEISKILSGTPLTTTERANLFKQIQVAQVFETNALHRESPLFSAIKKEFRTELREDFILQMNSVSAPQYSSEELIPKARDWGISLSALNPQAKDPGLHYIQPNLKSLEEAKRLLNSKGKNILDSYGFLDEQDIAQAFAAHNSQPWNLIESKNKTSFIDQWQEAVLKKRGIYSDEMYKKLFGDNPIYRDSPLTIGGDINLPGSKLGYFRATADQVETLRQNRLLTVTAIPDPSPALQGQANFLVRYEYPSVANYGKFAAYLPEDLLQKIKAAEKAGTLKDPLNEGSRKLTEEILKSLNAKTDQNGTPLQQFIQKLSLHPFTEKNEEIARLMYIKNSENGPPLLLKNGQQALLTKEAELVAMRDEGKKRLTNIANDLLRIQSNNPANPNYLESTEVYNSLFHSPVPIGNASEERNAVRAFFQNPKNIALIKNKQFSELDPKIWDFEIERLLKLPVEQRNTILSNWVISNLRPTPTTTANFNSILHQSLNLAEKDKNTVIQWWLNLASGKNAAFSDSLANFIEKLPVDLRKELTQELIKNNTSFSIPFSKRFLESLKEDAQSIFNSPATIAEKTNAAHYLLRDALAHPGNPNAATDDAFKELVKYMQDSNLSNSLVGSLAQSADLRERTKFIGLLLRMPLENFSNSQRNLILNGLKKLPQEKQLTFLATIFKKGSSEFANDAWTFLADNNQLFKNESLMEPYRQKGFLQLLFSESSTQANFLKNLSQASDPQKILSLVKANGKADFTLKVLRYLEKEKAWDIYLSTLQEDSTLFFRENKKLESSLEKLLQARPDAESFVSFLKIQGSYDEIKNAPLLEKIFSGLPNAKPQQTKYIATNLADYIAYRTMEPETRKILARRIFSASPEVFNALATEYNGISLLTSISSDSELASILAKMIVGMPKESKILAIEKILLLKIPLVEQFLKSFLSTKKNSEFILSLLSENRDLSSYWTFASQGLLLDDPTLRQRFAAALVNAERALPLDGKRVEQITKTVGEIKQKGLTALLNPDASFLSVADKAAIQSHFPLEDPLLLNDWTAKSLSILATSKNQEQIKTAIALFRRDASSAGGSNFIANANLLGPLEKVVVSADSQLMLLQHGMSQLADTLAKGTDLSPESVKNLMSAVRGVKQKDIALSMLKILGNVGGEADKQILRLFGERLLSQDPEIAQTALQSLGNYLQLKNGSGKNDILPYLVQFAKRNRSEKWNMSPKDALKDVLTFTSLDYEKDVLKGKSVLLPIERALATSDPCSSSFSSLAP